ncbi:MAG: hypothetical protein ACNA8W_26685, partial [Bradymonadaceae bacterium]
MPMKTEWTMPTDHATPVPTLGAHRRGEFASLLGDVDLEKIDAEYLLTVHRRMREDALRRADTAFGELLSHVMTETNLDAVATQAFRDSAEGRWVNKGLAEVELVLPSGVEVCLQVTYLLEKKTYKTGRKKRHGNRGKTGRGIYPALEVLGFAS